MFAHQTTLAGTIAIDGVGVHSGAPVSIAIEPGDAGTGFVFVRTLADGEEREIRAHHSLVGATELCTVLGDGSGASVSTTEHLLAALRGLGVDNARIVVDGPELPIVDGSSRPFVEAIDAVGLKTLGAARRMLKIVKPVRVQHGRAFAELAPAAAGFHMEVAIDFACPLIGRQDIAFELTPRMFREQIAAARTFGFLKDVERLWSAGFARGSSTENTIVLADDRVLNPEGLRFADEFVRHKALDAVGDLALAGLPLVGRFRSFCGGHRLNGAALGALLADRAAYEIVDEDGAPRRDRPSREPRHAGPPPAAATAFGPRVD